MMIGKLTQSLEAINPGRYFRSAFWLTLSKVASLLVSLAATFYIARALGPQNFGELSYAQSVVGILAIVSALTAAIYRDLVKRVESENLLLGTAWTVSFAGAFFTTVAAIGFIVLFPHDQLTITVIGILCLAQFFSPFSIISNVFYAKTETKLLAITNFILHVLVSIAKITAMLLGEGVLVLAMVMVFEQAAMAMAYSYIYVTSHKGSLLKWRFDAKYAKRLMADSFPLAIITVSGVISGRIDQVFLKHYLDIETVGLYSVAVQLSELWQFIPGLMLAAVFPAIVNAKDSPITYRNRLSFLSGALLLYGLTASVLMTVFAPLIVNIIYGSAFDGSVSMLQIYSWSIAGMVLSFLVSQFLLTENLRRIQIVCGIAPMAINIMLNLMLIPRLGATGAALATVISYSLVPLIPLTYGSVRRLLWRPASVS